MGGVTDLTLKKGEDKKTTIAEVEKFTQDLTELLAKEETNRTKHNELAVTKFNAKEAHKKGKAKLEKMTEYKAFQIMNEYRENYPELLKSKAICKNTARQKVKRSTRKRDKTESNSGKAEAAVKREPWI